MTKFRVAGKLPKDYEPLDDNVYMSPVMLLYFKKKLKIALRDQIIIEGLRGYQVEDYFIHQEIQECLISIEKGSYGYCKKTLQPIGIKNLIINPLIKCCFEGGP